MEDDTQQAYTMPSQDDDPYTNVADPMLGESDNHGVITRPGSRAVESDRYRAAKDYRDSIDSQLGEASKQQADAYAAQRKTLDEATQRLLGMQMGPSEDERHAMLAAALSAPGPGGFGGTISRVGQANADFLRQKREAEMLRMQLLSQYGGQAAQAGIGAANSRIQQLIQMSRVAQSDLNNAGNQLSKNTEGGANLPWYATRDPKTGKTVIDPAYLGVVRAGAQARADATANAGSNIQLNPLEEQMAHSIYNGQMPALPMSRLNPRNRAIMERVVQIGDQQGKPYDFANAKSRQAAITKWDSGPLGDKVRSIDVSLMHMGTLNGMIDALQNGDYQLWNHLRNVYKTQTGNPVPPTFEAGADFVGTELIKALVANGGAAGERDEASKKLSADRSPQTLRSIFKLNRDLLAGQARGLRTQYVRGTGYHDFYSRFLHPENQQSLGLSDDEEDALSAPKTSTPSRGWGPVRKN